MKRSTTSITVSIQLPNIVAESPNTVRSVTLEDLDGSDFEAVHYCPELRNLSVRLHSLSIDDTIQAIVFPEVGDELWQAFCDADDLDKFFLQYIRDAVPCRVARVDEPLDEAPLHRGALSQVYKHQSTFWS